MLASMVLAMQAFVRLSGASGKGANLELAQRQSSLTGVHLNLDCCPPPYAAIFACSGLAVVESEGIHMFLGCLHYYCNSTPDYGQAGGEKLQCQHLRCKTQL